ncbi:hypothetical protein [Haloimpatiens lingqiaonensis]|uniref:hypothetical protein n=1 Tax=Haloimpatiens lingqiaonensis TaxID=1380675 RepID=UPI0010FEE181|nr:hypothetical protein [Haloimpatiens lingqiaonensis]
MLKVSLLVTVLRGIPEIYLLFILLYILDNKKIDRKKIILSTFIISIIIYFVRSLPIHFGVHTIILTIFNIIVAVYINKISAIKVMSGSLIGAIIMFLCEGINLWIVQKFFNISFSQGFKCTFKGIIFSLPSLILFLIAVLTLKKVLNKEDVSECGSKNM